MRKLYFAIVCTVLLSSCNTFNIKPNDTIRFINGTYAVVTMLNEGNYNLVGGQEWEPMISRGIKGGLSNQWEIHSLSEGMRKIAELTSSGGMHNAEFMKEVKDSGIDKMSEETFKGILASLKNADEQAHFQLLHDAYKDFGEDAIKAWDLSRATFLLSNFYLANYFDEDTALEKSLKVAKEIQKTFKSWDDFNKSYMYGYSYWTNRSTGSPEYAERARLIRKLKEDKDSPYHVNWNTILKREW